MNLRTGLKTIAVALPMTVAPVKSSAQMMTKQIKDPAIIEQMIKNAESQKTVHIPDTARIYAKLGGGYGLVPFMDKGAAEAKFYGSFGIKNDEMKAQFDAAIGNATKSYTAKLGGIINTKLKNTGLETGILFRYNKNNPSKIKGVILEKEVNSTANDFKNCVPNNQNTAFFGAYATPSYKIKKAEVNANIEAGMFGFASIKNKAVNRENVAQAIKDGRMVDRPNNSFGANIGAGARYELAKGLKLGADVNYSTFDKHAGFNVGATYELGANLYKK